MARTPGFIFSLLEIGAPQKPAKSVNESPTFLRLGLSLRRHCAHPLVRELVIKQNANGLICFFLSEAMAHCGFYPVILVQSDIAIIQNNKVLCFWMLREPLVNILTSVM